MRKIIALASSILVCVAVFTSFSSKDDVKFYTDFLLNNMSLADSVVYDRPFWEKNVEKTLQVRERMGWNVSERDFRYFVLPLRVNNENLDEFRLEWADSLCRRVEGMSLEQAILEINHWCHEMATYAPSDARTSSPLATIRKGLGRCGEESVLTVAALRAAGIPARQVYTPRWAHTDDNHAWVEAVSDDGKWHFIGACEPEPKLDMAWFNAPVSRALLLHTKVFGRDYDGPEEVIQRTSAYTEINVTSNYVPVVKRVVKVVDEKGSPVEGAEVSFRIYNYAEFYPVASYQTDALGTASLSTGVGDMLVFASKDILFGIGLASGKAVKAANKTYPYAPDTVRIVLDKNTGQRYSFDFDIIPPVENPIPVTATEKEIAENKTRFERENQIREARTKGNLDVIDKFRQWTVVSSHTASQDPQIADKMLSDLSKKDLNDVSFGVLTDAHRHAGYPYSKYHDCPRIELEYLYPFFYEIGNGLEFQSPAEIAKWVDENISTDLTGNPQRLRIPPVFVWRSRKADPLSKDIFFVALCRAKRFEARIDEATGKAQYREADEWVDLHTGKPARNGFIDVRYAKLTDKDQPQKDNPMYYRHFTISRFNKGKTSLLALDENRDISFNELFSSPYPLEEGYYILTTGYRRQTGAVGAHMEFFPVEEAMAAQVLFTLRSSEPEVHLDVDYVYPEGEPVRKVAWTDIDDWDVTFLPDGWKKEVGIGAVMGYDTKKGRKKNSLIVLTGDKDEPTTHAVRQLSAISETINASGVNVLVLGKARPEGISNMVSGTDLKGKVKKMLLKKCNNPGGQLPIIVLCNGSGRILYYSQGYNTSLAEMLERSLQKKK